MNIDQYDSLMHSNLAAFRTHILHLQELKIIPVDENLNLSEWAYRLSEFLVEDLETLDKDNEGC